MYHALNISFRAGKKRLVQNVHLAITPGTFTAVVGPNGAGKSTLLKIMSGEQRPGEGEIRIDQTPIRKLPGRELAQVRAVLPQHSTLTFPFSAEEVVLLGCLPHRNRTEENLTIAGQVMRETDTLHLRDRLYMTLSGGEKQRVQLARVMAQLRGNTSGNRYLLLDEPTSSLDIACQHRILSRVKNLCRQRTGVLAVLHDLNLAAQYADNVLLLRQGRTVAYGPVAEVFTPENIEVAFSYPVRIIPDPQTGQPIIHAVPGLTERVGIRD
jgi:iron complex transport system ATP-binding protein